MISVGKTWCGICVESVCSWQCVVLVMPPVANSNHSSAVRSGRCCAYPKGSLSKYPGVDERFFHQLIPMDHVNVGTFPRWWWISFQRMNIASRWRVSNRILAKGCAPTQSAKSKAFTVWPKGSLSRSKNFVIVVWEKCRERIQLDVPTLLRVVGRSNDGRIDAAGYRYGIQNRFLRLQRGFFDLPQRSLFLLYTSPFPKLCLNFNAFITRIAVPCRFITVQAFKDNAFAGVDGLERVQSLHAQGREFRNHR